MSRVVPLAAVLLMPATLLAAPVPRETGGPAAPLTDTQRAEADIFAPMLVHVSTQIAEAYVRPVARHDLVHAALAGLYERAHCPPPPSLADDCKAAADDAALLNLVLRVRADIGDAPGLQGAHPLVVCCQAIARKLDPYTGVVSAEEQRRNAALEVDNRGVGLEIGDNPGRGAVLVKLVKPGGPAQRAGMRPGDEITHLDGKPVSEMSPEQLQDLLNQTVQMGPPSIAPVQDMPEAAPPLRLRYRREGAASSTTVTLDRACFRAETVLGVTRNPNNGWNYWVDPKERVAHLRLATLAKGTAQEMGDVLDELQRQGMRGLILDLRWCPGGFLDEAVDCARLFLGTGVVASIKVRTREPVVHRNEGAGPFTDVPMVVLVNGDTTGGGELIAAALQDHGRAKVVGQRTFGKASVQTPLHLGLPNTGMKLTSGTFERPAGKNLHRFPDSKPDDDWGVRPDAGLDFRVSADLNRQLKKWWQEVTLRPGSSRERLALDEPGADSPQQAALAAVMRLVEKKAAAKMSE
jgi:C-terminal processing protease CtpA/Prc